MPGFDHSVLTDVGWDALTDAEAGSHIEYVHLEAGDGYMYGGDTEAFGLTALKHKVMNFPITNFSNDGQGQITLVGVISSKNVATGFNFREIGVKCTVDGGPEILYAVANSGDAADYMPGSAESGVVIQTVQIVIKIDRATNVTVVIQPGLDVTCQNIGPATVGPGYFRDKVGQICYFKRINSPKKTLLLSETSDVVSIDIPVVDLDLDMWVALGNPDIHPHYSTIQKALDFLIPLRINPGITVKIYVAAGMWNNSPQIRVSHPQGSQIQIKGTPGPVKNVTTVARGAGTAVNLYGAPGTFSDMVPDDMFLYVNGATAAGIMISGIGKIVAGGVAADGSYIVYDTGFYGTFPSLGGVTGGTVTPLKTRLHFAVATGGGIGGPYVVGMNIENGGLGLMEYVALTSASYTTTQTVGLQVSRGVANLRYVGAWGWADTGIQDSNGFLSVAPGTLSCVGCHSCRGQTGFSAGLGAVTYVQDCYAQSNATYGFRTEGGHFGCSHSFACGGNLGFTCSTAGIMTMDYCNARNNSYGVYSGRNSAVNLGPYNPNTFTGNSQRDVYVSQLSSVLRTGPATVYGSSNVAPNVLSTDGCLFSP